METTKTTAPSEQTDDGNPSRREKMRSTINAIARAIADQLPNGDVADLRRLTPDDPSAPAFWKLIALYVEDLLPSGHESQSKAERKWAAIFSGMAIMKGMHKPGAWAGKALAEAQFSELRFVRLLRAKETALLDAIRSVAHFLSAKGQEIDWFDLTDLIFSDNTPYAEDVRRKIARSYYAALKNN